MTEDDSPADAGLSAAARVSALEQQMDQLQATHNAALLRLGLRHEAQRAGMVDLDGLRLIDPSTVTVDTHGEVVGAAALMADLRRAKPWLFGMSGSATSSTHSAPPAQPAQVRRATDMTYGEWQLARTALLRRV